MQYLHRQARKRKDPRRNDQLFLYVMPHAGGWGGFEGGDGEDGLINNVNGGFKDYPIEVFEVKYPAPGGGA